MRQAVGSVIIAARWGPDALSDTGAATTGVASARPAPPGGGGGVPAAGWGRACAWNQPATRLSSACGSWHQRE